jgi:hypothetical protein
MSMIRHLRRLACVAAVGIAVLGIASPARANLTVTVEDVGTAQTVVFTDVPVTAVGAGVVLTPISGNLFTVSNGGNIPRAERSDTFP